MKERTSRSPLAAALTEMLDNTGVLPRKEWARVLGVTPAAISQWVQDRTVPSAPCLRQIQKLLARIDRVPRDILDRFDSVASRPAQEVTPHGNRIGCRTIAEYMITPALNGLLSRLTAEVRSLPPSQQEKFISYAAERLQTWIDASLDDQLIRLRRDYPEKTAIDEDDLKQIFQGPQWKTLHVFATRPHELHEDADDDESAALFRSLTADFLLPPTRTIFYVSWHREVFSAVPVFRATLVRTARIKGKTECRSLPKALFNDILKKVGEKCGRGKASHVVAFDLEGEKAFGYAWFDNERGSRLGYVVPDSCIDLLREILPTGEQSAVAAVSQAKNAEGAS